MDIPYHEKRCYILAMAGTSTLSTLFRLWIPNDVMAELEARSKASGASKARLIVRELREGWGLPEPVEPSKQSADAAQ